jgi:quercetin dioxygenase-like cupin family protein
MQNDTTDPEVIRFGQLEIRYLQQAGNGSRMGCFEMRLPPGSNVPPPHSHTANEELVFVLDGVLRYTVDGVTRDLGPGDTMSTPAGSVHSFSNPHTGPARALVVNTPDIGIGYFREMAAIVGAGAPPDKARLLATMQAYGLQLPGAGGKAPDPD